MSWLDDLMGKEVRQNNVALPMRKILNIIAGGNLVVTVADNPGLGSTDLTINGMPAAAVSVDTPLTLALSGTRYNNSPAVANLILALPLLPTVGTIFYARVASAFQMKFLANTGQTIQMDALLSASAGYIRSNYVGASIAIEAISTTKWFCTDIQGPWTVDT